MSVTAAGSIMVASTRPNSTSRPGKRNLANPNATSALDSVTAVAAATPTTRLLSSQRSSGISSHTVA